METKEAEQLNLWQKPDRCPNGALGNTTELCRPPLEECQEIPKTPVKSRADGILKQKAVAMVEARRRDNYVLREIIKWRVLRPIEKNPHLYEKFQRSTSKRSKISFDRDLYCGHVIGSHVDIKQTSESASIVYAHTASCGASWVCPVCAAKIHARRTAEVQQFVDYINKQNALFEGEGEIGEIPAISHRKKILMLTFTASHNKSMSLHDFGTAISEALRRFQNSNIFKRFVRDAGLFLDDDLQIKGYIRACEYTHSYKNGWHKHFHVLMTVNDDADCDLLALILKALWLDYCRKVGLCEDDEKAKNSTYEHGLVMSDFDMQDAEKIVKYVTKCGGGNYAVQEITSVNTKKGRFVAGEVDRDLEHRTPNQIALDMVLYDEDKIAVKRDRTTLAEYLYHTHGTDQLFWSKYLKAFVGIVEKSDDEILEEENEGAAIICGLTVKHWHEVSKNVDFSVLKKVAKKGIDAVKKYFDGLDIGYELPPLLTAEEVRLLDKYEYGKKDENGEKVSAELSADDVEKAKNILSRLAGYSDDTPNDYKYIDKRSEKDDIKAHEKKEAFLIGKNKREFCPFVVVANFS